MRRTFLVATVLAGLLAAAGGALAQAGDFVNAEVRRVDAERGRVTLKHAEIKHLDMPPMTMVFNIDKALLAKAGPLAEGAKVQVKVAQVDGKYTVTDLRAAP